MLSHYPFVFRYIYSSFICYATSPIHVFFLHFICIFFFSFFFFNDPAPPEIYTLPLHDALPISRGMDDAAAQWAAIRRRVRALPAEPLTEAEALDRALLDGVLDILAWEDASAHFHRGNPCLYTGEAVFGVMALFLRDLPAPAAARRIEAAIARMRAVPPLLAEGQGNLRRAPRPWIER